ncbi:MAG: carboxylating nicotinate-nucleotide diphosphorylase [Candidatus Omnitrophica bacterium]|nr:carboxylating nicotinate-nucleotide diphosphorylase [Candidatus Omnitrophota bacterium]
MSSLIATAITEDQCRRDLTTRALVSKEMKATAVVIAKEEGVVYGLELVKAVFQKFDSRIKVKMLAREGQHVKKGQNVLQVQGRARAILSGERVALNLLSHLSGIATLTNEFVRRVYPFKVKILDTRKTLPGLRSLQKMAVRYGGGVNHRMNLSEMIMIKDNHHKIIAQQKKSLIGLIQDLRKKVSVPIEVEVDDLEQLSVVLQARPDVVLLDNMNLSQLRRAVEMRKMSAPNVLLEASGGIHLGNVRPIAQTGVDRISIGALTHSAKALDFSIEVK